MEKNNKAMKYAVVGTGAIGGYYGSADFRLACADPLLLSVVRQLFDFPLAGTNKTFTKSKTLYTLHQSSQFPDIQSNTGVKSGCRVV